GGGGRTYACTCSQHVAFCAVGENRPGARLEELLARNGGEGVDERRRSQLRNRLKFFGEIATAEIEIHDRVLCERRAGGGGGTSSSVAWTASRSARFSRMGFRVAGASAATARCRCRV